MINKVYLQKLLAHPSKRRHVQMLAGGSASSMPNISKAKLMTVPIEMPPLRLQDDFARRISAIERSKAQQRMQLAELDGLFKSLQDRAFAGLL
jgi:type I restriction enzyme S subunit